MFSASLVVGLLLSSHGDEPTREEKFRGALAHVEGRALTPRQELDALVANRPSLTGAETALGIGVALTVIGGVMFALPYLIRSFAISLSENGVWWAVLAGGLAGVGVLTGIIAGIVMAVLGAEQTRVDDRILELEAQQPRRASMKEQFSVPPHLILARF